MYAKKSRSKRVRHVLEAGVLHSARALATEKADEEMFDYPMVRRGSVFEETEKQVREMLSGGRTGAEDAESRGEAGDSDSRYIVLEKTEDDVSVEIKKDDGIRFYNPMRSEREFYGSSSVLEGTMPFHFRGKGPKAGSREAHTNRFPGALHLVIDSIAGYEGGAKDTAGVSVRVDVGGKTSESAVCQEKKNIALGLYVKVPVDGEGPVIVKASLVVHKASSVFFSRRPTAVSECSFELACMDTLQNRLTGMEGRWAPVRRTGIFRGVKSLFFHSEAPTGSVRLYASYIADDEVPTINAPPPTTLYSLNKWLAVRKHAHHLLFAGYLSVGYDGAGPKKMYVKWYGFTVFLFDAFLKRLLDSVNIADAELSCGSLEKGVLAFRVDGRVVELVCDTTEKLNGCMEAMSLLFPSRK